MWTGIEVWLESGVLTKGSGIKVIGSKAYENDGRVHRMTF